MPDHRGYAVKKLQEQAPKVPGGMGDATDVIQKNPPPVGAARNPGASPDPMFGREFSAEKDFQTLVAANKIRANKARLGAALSVGKAAMAKEASGTERQAALRINKDRGREAIQETPNRGATGRGGSRTRANNTFERVAAASKPNSGVKMDGQKGRW